MQSAGFFFLVALIFVYRFFYSRKIVGWHVGASLEAIIERVRGTAGDVVSKYGAQSG